MKFHIISHTHWDREWHKTYQEYRVKLIKFMDDLMDTLEKDQRYSFFMLDGQTSLLDDYLEIKPELKESLKKFIQEGRIIIGPWYVQPDEFLPSGESLVRNLLIGYKMGKEFGGYMNVGYLPDSFGQSAQMPQILKDFGIDSVVFYRGITDEDTKATEFIWQTPDGKEVLAIIMPIGYGNGMFLSPNLEKSVEQIEDNIKIFTGRATSPHILIMSGSDQCVAKKFLPNICERLNQYYREKGEDHSFEISNLEYYVEAVRRDGRDLPKLSGEFRKSKTRRSHSSIGATRLDIKKLNNNVQRLYERYLEPFSVLTNIINDCYDEHLIYRGWKYIVENHAHDSICCVCKDIVHDEMIMRMEAAKQIGETLLHQKKDYLSKKIRFNNSLGRPVIIYNTLPTERKDVVEATILVRDENFKLVNSIGEELPYTIYDKKRVNLAERRVVFGENPDDFYYEMDIAFITEIDGYGYHTHYLKEGEKFVGSTATIAKDNKLENPYIKLIVEKDGTITLFNKETGAVYHNLHVIEEGGNAGDEYDFSPPRKDKIITSYNCMTDCQIIENNSIRGKIKSTYHLEVPKTTNGEGRSNDMVDLLVESEFTLYMNSKYVEVKTRIHNTVTNHRIRVLFDTNTDTDKHFAEQAFGIIERKNVFEETQRSMEEKWHERYYPIYPQQRFVASQDKSKGLAVFNKGLPQYEILNGNKPTIALTLLSSVGWMGHTDLLYRPGRRSGAKCETPKAQLLGEFETEYALYPYGSDEKQMVSRKAHEYDTPLKTIMVHGDNEDGILPDTLKVLSIEGSAMATGAIKKHETSNGTVWRVYNTTDEKQDEVILKFNKNLFNSVELLNLREEKISWDNRVEVEMEASFDGAGYAYPTGAIKVKNVRPNEIFTFILERNPWITT